MESINAQGYGRQGFGYNYNQNHFGYGSSFGGGYQGYYQSQYNGQIDYETAYRLYQKGDLEGALPLFAMLCEQNNYIACLSSGIIQGQMINELEKDKKLSSKERKRLKSQYFDTMMIFYTKACNGGNYDACNNLAFYQYSTREERKKDKEEQKAQQEKTDRTLELYAQSCKAGNRDACQNLGVIYTDNLDDKNKNGQSANLSQAQNYYSRSCTMGDSVACFNLGVLRYNYAKSAADYAQAVHYFNQSCDNDYHAACLNLGIMYERGLTNDAKQDISDALQFYNKGCILGNANACSYLSKLANKQSKIKN